MKFWVNKDGHAVNAGIDHATAAMTHIMPRAVVTRISNDVSSDGLAVAIRDWMHVRGWMRVGIHNGVMSVVQPHAATVYHLTAAQRQWIDDKIAEDNSIKFEFNQHDILDAQAPKPSILVQKMVSDGTDHWG